MDAFMRKLEKKLAVRAEANQAKNGILLRLIDQNEIREHMTVTIIFPVGSELMVAKPDWERLFGQKMPDHLFEAGIQLRAVDAFEILFIVFFELC